MENSIAQMIQVGKLIKGMKPNQIKINTLKSSVLTLYFNNIFVKKSDLYTRGSVSCEKDPDPIENETDPADPD